MSDVINKDYLPHKYKVRQWEQSFNQKYGRRPSKVIYKLKRFNFILF